ncbi:MAG: hypothetical protein AB7O65_10220 [Candidatus Korobacteraceae bacterium]
MKPLRRAREAEVIAEFLRNEFYQQEFHHDREKFQALVMNGDTSDERENALRRALLFRRRGPMWRELPPDTQWWEVQLQPEDLPRISVFPRAHWRKIAGGSFRLPHVIERIRQHPLHRQRGCVDSDAEQTPRNLDEFVAKIRALNRKYAASSSKGAIVLIGTSEREPALVFEGNHRLTASLLDSPGECPEGFRVFFGSSPSMVRCCWYQSRLTNLLRYTLDRILHLGYDREADVDRVLRELDRAYIPPATAIAREALAESLTAERKSAPTSSS